MWLTLQQTEVSTFVNLVLTQSGGPISEVIEGHLWLGNIYAAKSEETMNARGITHILACTQFGACMSE